jgi:hypothetical protein
MQSPQVEVEYAKVSVPKKDTKCLIVLFVYEVPFVSKPMPAYSWVEIVDAGEFSDLLYSDPDCLIL